MLNRFIHIIIDPLILFLLFFIAGIFFRYKGERKKFKVLLMISGVWFLIISTPFIPEMLLERLESQYRPVSIEVIQTSEKPVEILILGGGHKNDLSIPPVSRLSDESLARLIEGVRIHKINSEMKLVLSGTDSGGKTTQADMLYKAALELGVNRNNLVKHGDPIDTWDEIGTYRDRMLNWEIGIVEKPNTVIIVTSASHMPRATKMAKNQLPPDLNIISSPTDYQVKSDENEQFDYSQVLPSINNMAKMKTAMREYAGLAEYYLILR